MEPMTLLSQTDYHKIEQVIQRLKTTQREIFIFPSGGVGENLLCVMQKLGIKIAGLGDNATHKIGQKLHEIPILSFAEISEQHPDAIILIGSRIYALEIMQQFRKAGFSAENLIFEEFNGYAAVSKLDVPALIQNNQDKLQKLLPLLADEQSRKVLYGYLNYLHTFDAQYIEQIRSQETMYFDASLYALSADETVVDGGGYTGDTFSVFSGLVPSFDTYFLCEPMHDIINKAKARLGRMNFSGSIRYIEKALWDCESSLFFDAHGSGSMVEQTGNVPTLAAPLDEIVEDKDVTLIKLDVEGSEEKALLGARQTIARCHPKLAVCVYHLTNMFEHGGFDILDLPLKIKELHPSYQIYLRHYGSGLTDAVCYAL
ncbi:MAG: FkbM family methyltransferase [Butyricicoccus sp.]|nr:FkbM family methyltransferase [Butyricicoccus sp.]